MKLLDFAVGTPFSEALGWTVFHSLWEGIVIAAAFAALLASVRSPRIRYVAGCVALLALLTAFAATLIQFFPEGHNGVRTLAGAALAPPGELAGIKPSSSRLDYFAALIPWLAPLWLLGVCLFYLRYIAGCCSVYRLRRSGVCIAPASWQRAVTRLALELKVSRPVVLLESLLAEAPVVLGHFRPTILVPLGFLAGLSPAQVEAILLHELAHVRRSDYFMNVCQRLVEGLLFYHPAVWWISRVVRAERENCCDDMVVASRGDAHGYAIALIALEQNRLEHTWPACEPAMAATGGNLLKRARRLLYPARPCGTWIPAALAAVALLFTTAMALSALHADPSPSFASQQASGKIADPWKKWLNEDVVYIISAKEKLAFESLKTDEERQHFVEQFWERRNPVPGSPDNKFKVEHYRRIAYANTHYSYPRGRLPGWKTGRGQIYIMYGPPDEIDSHPSGGRFKRPAAEGGGFADTYAFEDWRYRYVAGKGSMDVEFIDPTMSGEFRIAANPNAKYKKP
jgi:GWxTD domain-containing protein